MKFRKQTVLVAMVILHTDKWVLSVVQVQVLWLNEIVS